MDVLGRNLTRVRLLRLLFSAALVAASADAAVPSATAAGSAGPQCYANVHKPYEFGHTSGQDGVETYVTFGCDQTVTHTSPLLVLERRTSSGWIREASGPPAADQGRLVVVAGRPRSVTLDKVTGRVGRPGACPRGTYRGVFTLTIPPQGGQPTMTLTRVGTKATMPRRC